ncbi:MAG: hypothetical protein FJ009_14785 [Chloroflexi bacterium]|nr:hypothetical protein [Chloroflexota bacterium]
MANLVNIFLNDPGTRDSPLVHVAPPQGKSPFTIPGWNGAGGLFAPGTPEFQAGQLYVVLTRTYNAWVDFFDRDFPWQSQVSHLAIVPRAGEELNAYYDRHALKFCYAANPLTRQMIYTCESSDIIAHECGHAILDAQHPEYWDALLSETTAFHEAFGDVAAVLSALDVPQVRALILAENGGDLRRSNSVTRLAEQMARGFYDAGYAHTVVSPDALRDLANQLKYRDPETLPGRTPAATLSSESHNFSRIFSGALYDALVGIYEQLRKENVALSPDAALAQARNDTGHLLAQGLLLAPQGDALFKTMAVALLMASQQNFGGAYFPILKKVFVARRLLKGREADALRDSAGALHAQTSALAGVASVPLSARPTWDLPEARVGEDLPSGIRKWMPVPKTEFRLTRAHTRRDQSRVLYYAAARPLAFKGDALGAANGAKVVLADAVAIQVDPDGIVVSSHFQRVDRGQEKRARDHVAKLIARRRVYAAKAGERVDPAELIAQKKPYYIAYDEQGDKQIRRAFIACG